MRFEKRHPWRIPYLGRHPALIAVINVILALACVGVTFVVTRLL